MNPPLLITEAEAIERLGLARLPDPTRAMRELRYRGLPCVRLSLKRRMYRPADLESWIRHRVTQEPNP